MTEKQATILEGLNSEQKKAVSCVDGPVLIVAGAGSGKTRVLTHRTAFIIEGGCPPERILALTFTKKAAGEMKERISRMVGEKNARRIYMGTFHSVFVRFLREYAECLGYPKDFTIYDQSDSQSAVKACIKEMGLDDTIYKPRDVLSRISMAKNNLVTPGAYRNSQSAMQNDMAAKKGRIVDIYEMYWTKLRKMGVMDFDDLLFNMNILFKQNPKALEELASRFDYIMVDEYQDTNFSQYLIVRELARWHRNICVVGDDSQSIYAFRGAKIENILNFKKYYENCHVFRLEQNYRSTRTIVDAANSLIAKNSNRIPKVCFSSGEEGNKIKLIQALTGEEEARLVVIDLISSLQSNHAEYQDFAILYRTNSQSRAIEEQLRRRNIPYVVYSGNAFFDRAEVKDMMAYFKLAANINDDESFKRIVNTPARGIGDTSLKALQEVAAALGKPLFSTVFSEELPKSLRTTAVDKMKAFCQMILKYSGMLAKTDAYEVALGLANESGYLAMHKADTSIEGQARLANVEELLNSVKTYVDETHNTAYEELLATMPDTDSADIEIPASELPVVTLGEFLENISLLSNVDMTDEEDTHNKVSLMTAHSSKGLEFPYVYVTGMEENLFPSGGSLATVPEIEEERRLFYVAMTRAQKNVTFCFATSRMRNGKTEANSPSRFIREIDRQYFKNPLPDGTDRRTGKFGADGSFGLDDDDPFDFEGRRKWQKPSPRNTPVNYTGRRTMPVQPTRPSVPAQAGPSRVGRPAAKPVPLKAPAADFQPSPVASLRAGQRIEHNRFGFGKILEITGSPVEAKAKIAFDDYGEKILLLNYAKIRIVE